jgi:hypothetical protein
VSRPRSFERNDSVSRWGDLFVGDDAQVTKRFLDAIAQHRHWTRKGKNRLVVPSDGDETRGKRTE